MELLISLMVLTQEPHETNLPPVSLADCTNFCVTGSMARSNWLLSQDNFYRITRELTEMNHSRYLQERNLDRLLDAERRRNAWNLLDDVLFMNMEDQCRLGRLSMLRDLIGPENYYSGRMPSPVPPG